MSPRTLWPSAGTLLILSVSAFAGRVMVYDTAKPASTAAPMVKQAPESRTKAEDVDVDDDEFSGDALGASEKSKPAKDKQALFEREERMKALQEITALIAPEWSLAELLSDDVKKKS